MEAALDLMQRTWAGVAGRYEAYQLVIPGVPGFICQPDVCTARCCHVFSVAVSDSDVGRMTRESRMQPMQFLESEDGSPIRLPLAHPYLLARQENHCRMLGSDLGCTQYHGRPDACRLYPHFVVFIDPATGRPVHDPPESATATVEAVAAGGYAAGLVPLLLRHFECPGFTGPPMSFTDWNRLLLDTFRMQYSKGSAEEVSALATEAPEG
jgi:hypothetical protein